MQLDQQIPITRQQMMHHNQQIRPDAFGFKGRAFPLLSFILGMVSYIGTYLVARSRNPPDVHPFPQTDILHPAIHYPQYLIYRIGMLVYPVVYCLSMQTLKNFLQMKSFQFRGEADMRLSNFGVFSVVGALLMCCSTAAISDGGDLNYPLYYWGSRLYWLLTLWMIFRSSQVYQTLWQVKHFVPEWTYQFKKYGGYIALGMIILYVLQELDMLVETGYYLEWMISLFIVMFVFTLYWDLKDMDILLRRK